MDNIALSKTVLYDLHIRHGGKMVPFAGFEMPIQYQSILVEAKAVRTSAGIFDVSHMGRILIEGSESQKLVNWIHSASINDDMPLFRARYGLICNENGGIIDDAIVYKLSNLKFLLIPNAANLLKIFNWLQFWKNTKFPSVTISDQTSNLTMLAIQGPNAIKIVEQAIDLNLSSLKAFTIMETSISDSPVLIARTGYTGEDGVEIMAHVSKTEQLWIDLVSAGVMPCGLGSRDILRLEAGLLLHGQDIDETINPIEAGLRKFVDFSTDFCGSLSINNSSKGTMKTLIGFATDGRSLVPRSHANILYQGELIGVVTSGGFSPTLDTNIGLGYVQNDQIKNGSKIVIDVRGRDVEATVTQIPFYRR